jgi:hypothetical protein
MNYNFILTFNELYIKNTYIFIIKNIFKYDFYYFYKIVININALKYLIIKLKQF